MLIKEKPAKTQIVPIRNLSDPELLDLSKDTLFLNIKELPADFYVKLITK